MKRANIIAIALFSIIFLSVFGIAAGSSEIPTTDTTPSPSPTIEKTQTPQDTLEKTKTACDSKSTRLERIKCRIKNKLKENEEVDYEKRVPEACIDNCIVYVTFK